MDRLTTGRRHPRAGSVTVTELISRQATPTHCTDSSPADLDDDEFGDLDGTEVTDTIPVVLQAAHRREPTRSAQLAKLASLGVAGAILCGAVAISSVIAHQRREATTNTGTRPTVQITGEQALLPDKLDRTLPKTPDSTPAPVQERPTPTASTKTPPPGLPDTGTAASGSDMAVGAANDEALVREFYESLPDAPAVAFDMLSTNALDMSFSEFLASWSLVDKIDGLDVQPDGDKVLATVRMRLLDGGQLRVQQLLTVAESPRRIVGVQLLSAQRN